jgi:hypothetical protein
VSSTPGAPAGRQHQRRGTADDDPRFRADPAWTQWPFNRWRTAFRNAEVFWREASKVPGVSTHHGQLVDASGWTC